MTIDRLAEYVGRRTEPVVPSMQSSKQQKSCVADRRPFTLQPSPP